MRAKVVVAVVVVAAVVVVVVAGSVVATLVVIRGPQVLDIRDFFSFNFLFDIDLITLHHCNAVGFQMQHKSDPCPVPVSRM